MVGAAGAGPRVRHWLRLWLTFELGVSRRAAASRTDRYPARRASAAACRAAQSSA